MDTNQYTKVNKYTVVYSGRLGNSMVTTYKHIDCADNEDLSEILKTHYDIYPEAVWFIFKGYAEVVEKW